MLLKYCIHSLNTFTQDAPRTEAYMTAIKENTDDFKEKVVMDLGCGTGILSLFAADAGALQVHAVDNSKMIFDAMEICLYV